MVAAIVGAWATPLPAAEVVGSVKLVKEWAYERLMPADWDDLYLEDPVFSNQQIRTPPDAAVHVRFLDGTQFRVGANSVVVIDSYVYDADRNTGQLAATLGKGVFRLISGNLKDYRFETPTATIGIRGSDVIMAVLDTDQTVMQVNQTDHTIDIACSSGPGRRFECRDTIPVVVASGETAGIVDGTVAKGVAVPDDPGLRDDAGLASLNPQGGGPLRFDFGFGGSLENPNTTSNFLNTR